MGCFVCLGGVHQVSIRQSIGGGGGRGFGFCHWCEVWVLPVSDVVGRLGLGSGPGVGRPGCKSVLACRVHAKRRGREERSGVASFFGGGFTGGHFLLGPACRVAGVELLLGYNARSLE